MVTTRSLRKRVVAVLGGTGAATLVVACSSSTTATNTETPPEVQVAAAPPTTASASAEVEEDEAPPSRDPMISHWQPTADGTRRGCTVEREIEKNQAAYKFSSCPRTLYPVGDDSQRIELREPRPPQARPDDTLSFQQTLTQEARNHGELRACCYQARTYYQRNCPPDDPLCRPIQIRRGRPLLEASTPILAPSVPSTQWLLDVPHTSSSHDVRREWLAIAAAEHSSVAAFSRVALQLLVLGAPASLVQQAQLAARDEIDHAQIAWSIAGRCGDQGPFGAGPLTISTRTTAPSATHVEVAVDAFREGCVEETVAALALSRAASLTSQRWLREALTTMAEDEARHAELAWRIVRWALGAGGSRVRDALRCAATEEASRELVYSPTHQDHEWGLLGASEASAVHVSARENVILPCVSLLLGGRVGGSPV